MKKGNWKKYSLEFLSIFIAVTSAFALENWNDNRRNSNAESKIITEIHNGLKKDLDDIRVNMLGHKDGIKACVFLRDIVEDRGASPDSILYHYLNLTRDFISIQNVSGYETLKSRGLELLKDDSLRSSIIALYEYDYNILRKFEEEYYEMQFQENYFKEINAHLAPNFIFDQKGNIVSIDLPLNLTASEKKILLSYLWKIQANRNFILYFYADVENKINQVLARMEKNQ